MKTIAIGDRVYGKKHAFGVCRSIYGVVIETEKDGLIKIQNNLVNDRCQISEIDSLPVADWCLFYDLTVEQIELAIIEWIFHNGQYETQDGVVLCQTIEDWLKLTIFCKRNEMRML
jgi:hypothetical protein